MPRTGLLYLGSGIGLTLIRLIRDRSWRLPDLAGPEWLWLLLAIAFFGEHASAPFLLAALLMAIGVWLHLTEPPAFLHAHRAIVHTHWHRHDAEHQHEHDFPWDGREPHTHEHAHAADTPGARAPGHEE